MKKILTFVAVLTLLIVPASAQTQTNSNEMTPEHPLWGLDTFFESLKVNFAMNKSNKAKLALENARERVREMNVMRERGVDDASLYERAAVAQVGDLDVARENAFELSKTDKNASIEVHKDIEDVSDTGEDKIQEIITRFENDDNPNNDNALKGLNTALNATKNAGQQAGNNIANIKMGKGAEFDPGMNEVDKPDISDVGKGKDEGKDDEFVAGGPQRFP